MVDLSVDLSGDPWETYIHSIYLIGDHKGNPYSMRHDGLE